MKHIFVINPHSFRAFGSLDTFQTEVHNCFSKHCADDYEIHISRYPRDAIAVVHNYIQNCDKGEIVRVYAVGGDGILFECLNGMVGFENAELTSVPYGNANDFTRIFGENSAGKFRDIKNLLTAPSRLIDIIHCGSNYALMTVAVGLVGETIIQASKTFIHLPAKWLRKNIGFAYSLCAVKAMFNKKMMNQSYSMKIDDEHIEGHFSNIFICNSATTGGGLTPIPYAMPNDGVFDVMLIDSSKLSVILRAIGDHNKGHFEKHSFLHHKVCKTMEIKSGDLLSVSMDGEAFYAREISLSIIPGGVKIFIPEGLDFVDYSYKAYKSKKSGGDIVEK
jgi:diacylglycerol kinase family enzyme